MDKLLQIIQEQGSDNDLYDLLIKNLSQNIVFDYATLFLEKDGKLTMVYQLGDDVVELGKSESDTIGFASVSKWMLKNKNPVVLENLPASKGYNMRKFTSFLSIPMWNQEKLIGTINLGHSIGSMFLLDDIKYYRRLGVKYSFVFQYLHIIEQNSQIMNEFSLLEKKNNVLERNLSDYRDGKHDTCDKTEIIRDLSNIEELVDILNLSAQTLTPDKIKRSLNAIQTTAKRIQKTLE